MALLFDYHTLHRHRKQLTQFVYLRNDTTNVLSAIEARCLSTYKSINFTVLLICLILELCLFPTLLVWIRLAQTDKFNNYRNWELNCLFNIIRMIFNDNFRMTYFLFDMRFFLISHFPMLYCNAFKTFTDNRLGCVFLCGRMNRWRLRPTDDCTKKSPTILFGPIRKTHLYR